MIQKIFEFLTSDKMLHFLICFFLVEILSELGLPYWGIAIASAAAIGKELYDLKKGGVISYGDLIADAVGIILAVLI